MEASRLGALVVAFVVVVGLSGATSASVPNAFARRAATAGKASAGRVAFRIKVPSKVSTSPAGLSRLQPHYISVATLSVAILTDGKNPVVANVSYGVAYVVVRPAAGTHKFTVTAYDQLGAHGNALSTGTTAPVVVPAAGEVRVALTLGGVVGRVSLALDQINPTIGAPATIGLEVTAQDADGNTILGETAFAHAFTLTSSDAVSAKISQSTIARATEGITVAYDGASVPQITFSASGAGLQVVLPATLVPLPPPAAGSQLFVIGSPNAAFATSNADQILTTFGVPAPMPFYSYSEAAADTTASRLYVVANYYIPIPNDHIASRLDIFNVSGSGGYTLVDSFQPAIYPEGIAIDSAAQRLYASDFYSTDVSIFSTATGHAIIGKITTGLGGAQGPDLAVDPTTRRLFVSDDGDGGGLIAYSTVPPYARVGTLATGPHENLAIDVAAGKLYALEFEDDYTYEYITVYDTSTLKRVARFAPFSYTNAPSALAVDSSTHRLFVQFPQSELSPTDSTVQVYGTGTGQVFPLLGSFAAGRGYMTVAPYGPYVPNHASRRNS